LSGEIPMTLCPIAIVAGCQKCPAFKICPLKGIIGDVPQAAKPEPASSTSRGAEASKK